MFHHGGKWGLDERVGHRVVRGVMSREWTPFRLTGGSDGGAARQCAEPVGDSVDGAWVRLLLVFLKGMWWEI